MFTFYQTPLKKISALTVITELQKHNLSYKAQHVTLIISFQLPGLSFAQSGRVRQWGCRTKRQCLWECPGALYKWLAQMATCSGNTTCFAGVLYCRKCMCPTFLQDILDLREKNTNSDFQLQSNVFASQFLKLEC